MRQIPDDIYRAAAKVAAYTRAVSLTSSKWTLVRNAAASAILDERVRCQAILRKHGHDELAKIIGEDR